MWLEGASIMISAVATRHSVLFLSLWGISFSPYWTRTAPTLYDQIMDATLNQAWKH